MSGAEPNKGHLAFAAAALAGHLGRWRLDKLRFTPDDLRTQLYRALYSSEVHARLAVIRATFELAGGVARARREMLPATSRWLVVSRA